MCWQWLASMPNPIYSWHLSTISYSLVECLHKKQLVSADWSVCEPMKLVAPSCSLHIQYLASLARPGQHSWTVWQSGGEIVWQSDRKKVWCLISDKLHICHLANYSNKQYLACKAYRKYKKRRIFKLSLRKCISPGVHIPIQIHSPKHSLHMDITQSSHSPNTVSILS